MTRAVESSVTVLATLVLSTLTWQVVARFLPFLPSSFTEELARYAFLYMSLLGAALAVRRSQHFGLTLVTERLPMRWRRQYLRWAVRLPILLASVLLLIFGLRYAFIYGLERLSPTFHVRMIWVFLAVPLAALPMTLFAAHALIWGSDTEGSEPGAAVP